MTKAVHPPVQKRKHDLMAAVHEVLCATKVESPAYSGLRYSFFIAEQFHCPLQVLNACEGIGSQQSNTYVSSAQRMAQTLASHRLRERLDAIVRAVPTGGPGRATSHIADGTWTEAVLAFSERQRADVIVLGSSPDGTASSTTLIDHVVQRATCPVLTVPSRDPAGPPRLKRMLLAVEPEATTGLLVEWAALWAHRFGAVVQLFYCESSPPEAGATRSRWQHEVEEKLRTAGVQIEGCFAYSRLGVSENLVAQASLSACDLIMMSANLRDEAERRVVSSVRKSSPLPVLSVRVTPPDRMFVDPALRRVDISSLSNSEAQAMALLAEGRRFARRAG